MFIDKLTPLEHAVSGGNLPALRFLLDHGADIHQECEESGTVLHQAALKGTTTTSYKRTSTKIEWLHVSCLCFAPMIN
jgi:ankyrin repeat protein